MNDNIAAPTAAEQDAALPAHDGGGGGGASAGFAGFSGVSLTPYYWIFAASGFAGLIYESVWARYIKLFLGNAASAQVLVLAVFLVSLAIGAALCAKISERLERPLLLYAAIEVVVALVAVYFHDIFVAAQNWAVLSVMPRLESDFAVDVFKLAFAAALIAPQTILLGATFPLMSAGLARLRPDSPGRVISLLYFTNTLGGAAGVLVSGFLLVPTLGLPGTVLIAGLLNAFAGGAVWWLSRRQELGKVLTAAAASASAGGGVLGERGTPAERGGLQTVILTAAFVTGLASLVYEVVWIRMLSVLLGPVTQIFELMLAAFILGLALGGWAVRRRADAAGEPLFLLAGVQLAMGVLALWSLFAFPLFYDILRQTLVEISRDETGYLLYNLLAGGLAMAMMLPAAFCAGMTLPLLTRRLLSAGGEGAIGKVYAVNTLGAVIGAAAALYIFLPNIGIQLSIAAAAALDMLLGLLLFFFVAARRSFAVGTGLTAAALTAALLFGGINPQIAAASVFYRPMDELPLVVFHKNGKTAYVSIIEETLKDGTKRRTIKTNGAVNAAVSMSDTPGDGTLTIDEITTTMLGLLPLLYRPDAETVMNIGFGSGMTTRTLLASPALRRLDNVEIEPVMAEGAKHLGPRIAPVFADERNRFVFNDAKTVLARGGKYDIIISEPSYPWISGVAGLFTQEFYAQIRRSLTKNGVFAQLMPMYEQSPQQVASVVQALATEFGDFNLYLIENSSLLFVAAADKLPPLKSDIFAAPEARRFLGDYRYTSVNDAKIAFLGDKELLMPYFMSFNVPTNSDYYPYLENNAFRTAFLRTNFSYFGEIPLLPVPLLEMLSGGGYSAAGVSPQPYSQLRAKAAEAARFFAERHAPDGGLQKTLADIATLPCPAEVDTDFRVLEKISSLVSLLMPVTKKEKMEEIWAILETNDCITRLLVQNDTVVGVYARFWRALSLRDAAEITLTTDALLPYAELDQPSGQILLLAAAAAHYQQQNYRRAILLLLDMPQINPVSAQAARWVGGLAAEKL